MGDRQDRGFVDSAANERLMKKLILITILLMSTIWSAFAEEGIEIIAGFDMDKDLPVLNNEIRKLDTKNQDMNTRVLELEAKYAADTAANDTYTISLSTAPTAYTDGMEIIFKAVTANTGACTVNVNGLGAKSLKSLHDQDPADNYIEAGSLVHCAYDGTNFEILSPDNNP